MNIDRLVALENLEQGLRVDMRRPFLDCSSKALNHPRETACCHAGWGVILAYSSGFPDVQLWMACSTTRQYLDLPWEILAWLCTACSHFADEWIDCTEREGRLRLRILIELQFEDLALLTAELRCRMAEPEAPVAVEQLEAVEV